MKNTTIAVFDFDGTITTKDTLFEFIKFSRGAFRFCVGMLLFSPLFVAFKLKLLPNWKVKQFLFAYFYKGISIDDFNKWGNDFIPVIEGILRPKAVEALKHHQNNGDKLVIVSASMKNWIKPWADKTGIDLVIATQIEIDSANKITGKFSTKNCYGQEKVNRLMEMFPDRNNYKIIAYGDSCGDKELIEMADEGFYNKFHY